jgi:hypothetical protein
MGHQAGGIEKCAVATDGDDEVGLFGYFGFGNAGHQFRRGIERVGFRQQRLDTALPEVRQENQRGFGNSCVAESAYKRASLRR